MCKESEIIYYKDIDEVDCETREEFNSIDEFIQHCMKYNIRVDTFTNMTLGRK
jgi:hypothetical protein